MLGPPKARNLDRPVLISLESAVPHDHFYRHLERTLDLLFVRDLVADCYASGGRPSIDPVVFFKLHLVMFFEGIRSERKLIEIARLSLAMRWYLGYNLDEPLPDHSSLSKIRARLELPVFRRFFAAIVEQCVAAGLVWGKELIFDATKVRANASMGPGVTEAVWFAVFNSQAVSPHRGLALKPSACAPSARAALAAGVAPRGTGAAVCSCSENAGVAGAEGIP